MSNVIFASPRAKSRDCVTRTPVNPLHVKPARNPAVTRVLRWDAATATLTLIITTGRKVLETAYSVERIGSDFGDGFRLTKNVPHPGDQCETYHVHLSAEGHSCECMGFLRHAHCKHVDSLLKLRELRELGKL